MDLGEMIELMKEEVMLGSDFSQIDFLFDNTAVALAELYFHWKDNGKLDYDHEEAIWDKVTGFTASKEALAFLLRQLTDIKNEVPDEDGIREIVDLWKNEDSGEIAPAWLEHLNQLIDRLDSEQEARQMYIKKYWGNFIGGSDDSLNLVAFLEDQKKEEIPLSEIFAKIGLDKQNWDFRQTVEYLEFTHSDGVEMDFHFAIDVVTDLAAILLECSVSGSVNLQILHGLAEVPVLLVQPDLGEDLAEGDLLLLLIYQKGHKVQAVVRASDKVTPVFFDIHLLRLLFRN